eukprot:4084494-Alexandrium_andersonii.AAC.1
MPLRRPAAPSLSHRPLLARAEPERSTAEGLQRFQRFKQVRAASSCFEQFPTLPLRGATAPPRPPEKRL